MMPSNYPLLILCFFCQPTPKPISVPLQCLPEVPKKYQRANLSMNAIFEIVSANGVFQYQILDLPPSICKDEFQLLICQKCWPILKDLGFREGCKILLHWKHGVGWVNGALFVNETKTKIVVRKEPNEKQADE